MAVLNGFRLSAQQERIWLQQGEDASRFEAECEVLLGGEVDENKLRRALDEVVSRHEILRTVFQRQASLKIPFQVIQDEGGYSWNSRDVAGADLARGPLFAASLDGNVLSLRLPALCADLLSLRNLVSEIGRAYEGIAAEEDPLQYADVVEWQEELLTGEDTKAGRDFWSDYCKSLAFPVSVQGNLKVTNVTYKLHSSFKPDRDLILACWNVFLARITGSQSILIGCSLDGRKYAELKNAIGPFAAYLPLQLEIDPEQPVVAAVEETSRAMTEAYNWQESFSCRTPELEFGFDYSDLTESLAFGSSAATVLREDACGEHFALRLSARRVPTGTELAFYYDPSQYTEEKITHWGESFRVLLEAAFSKPETPVNRLPLLTPAERHKLVVEWNRTAADFPRDLGFHQLFEQQAARTPERPAVRCEDKVLTYAELNEQANRLAHALKASGVGPDSLVGLCVERGVNMIAALLGIFKAGGAYVPLSADQPAARLEKQIAGVAVLVTETQLRAALPRFTGPVITLDAIPDGPVTNPEVRSGPENIAYVIYTSGSTGTPKGVAVRHRNLVNYAWFIKGLFPEGLSFATVSTLGADLGNTSIYPALISGGCLHVIPHAVAAEGDRMADYAERYPFDILKIVPSHLNALLDSTERNPLPRKFLITGGELLTPRLVDKVRARNPQIELFNHYGPTETTVGSLTLRLRDADRISIGRPIANTRLYILDANRELVPAGAAGELYIAGEGVTAGYLNLPERTAERFLPDPFAEGRMYRTGDLVRYFPDGNVEFLGRADDQVKIRGFRIEPGEIEAVLASHEAVRQAVVAARPDELGGQRLVAWVAQRGEYPNLQAALREHLLKQLPDYMVPSAIVTMARLPLTPNGKIDRQNLPEPDAATSSSYVAPRTPVEAVVAGIWAEVLKREQVGVEDNFFEIGGHSLLATQVISRVRRSLEIDPPLKLLFESPTVAKLAAWIDEARREGKGLVAPPIGRVSRDEPLPLSFAQQRLWVIDQLDRNNPMYNIPRTLRMKGNLKIEALHGALNEIVRRHESQRTTFAVRAGKPVQVISEAAAMPLPLRDLTDVPEGEREEAARELARQEALEPFDLAAGPLVRAQILRLAEDDHLLLLTAHHIVSDAWSAGLFFRELGILYEAFTQGRPSPLPEPAIQYADYAVWQREWLQGEALNTQLEYWREHLRGVPAVLELPLDRPRSKTTSHEGSSEAIPFSAELTPALRALSRQEDVTLFMTLLAGFQAFLSKTSGQEQIVVGTDLANRTTAEAEQLIGFFINVLPMRTDLSGNPTFRELLRRVRGAALGAYAHQDMPFDKIVEELQPERSSEHSPLVQALFVMQNTPAPPRQLAGLELSGMGLPVRRSKFDLAVFMTDKGEQLVGHWVYRTELFERATILRIAGHFETLLRSAAADPETRLNALTMLSDEEQKRIEDERKGRKRDQHSRLRAAEPKPVTLGN